MIWDEEHGERHGMDTPLVETCSCFWDTLGPPASPTAAPVWGLCSGLGSVLRATRALWSAWVSVSQNTVRMLELGEEPPLDACLTGAEAQLGLFPPHHWGSRPLRIRPSAYCSGQGASLASCQPGAHAGGEGGAGMVCLPLGRGENLYWC